MNGLENQGAQLLSSVLPKNKTLRELDLSNNRIEKDGASIFAANLEKSRSLKKLSFGENPIGTLGSLVLLKAIDHSQSQVEFLDLKNILINDDFYDLCTQINQYLRPLQVVHGGIRGKLGKSYPTLSGFTMLDDLDLNLLDKKSLHTAFQRNPFKILRRLATENGHDFLGVLKKWDIQEHDFLTYSIYVVDFPTAVSDAGIVLDKTLSFILWNHLKSIQKNGSVSYLQFIEKKKDHEQSNDVTNMKKIEEKKGNFISNNKKKRR